MSSYISPDAICSAHLCSCEKKYHPNRPVFLRVCRNKQPCTQSYCFYVHEPDWNPVRINMLCPIVKLGSICKNPCCKHMHMPLRAKTHTTHANKQCNLGTSCPNLGKACPHKHDNPPVICRFGATCRALPNCLFRHERIERDRMHGAQCLYRSSCQFRHPVVGFPVIKAV